MSPSPKHVVCVVLLALDEELIVHWAFLPAGTRLIEEASVDGCSCRPCDGANHRTGFRLLDDVGRTRSVPKLGFPFVAIGFSHTIAVLPEALVEGCVGGGQRHVPSRENDMGSGKSGDGRDADYDCRRIHLGDPSTVAGVDDDGVLASIFFVVVVVLKGFLDLLEILRSVRENLVHLEGGPACKDHGGDDSDHSSGEQDGGRVFLDLQNLPSSLAGDGVLDSFEIHLLLLYLS